MTGLLDTNVALYLLGGRLAKPMPAGNYAISVITEMELLTWPSLTTEDEKKVREFVAQLTVCELTPSIRNRAVQLRKAERLKLPDAIVCATALEFGVELWTNDETLMKVSGLVCRSVALTVNLLFSLGRVSYILKRGALAGRLNAKCFKI